MMLPEAGILLVFNEQGLGNYAADYAAAAADHLELLPLTELLTRVPGKDCPLNSEGSMCLARGE